MPTGAAGQALAADFLIGVATAGYQIEGGYNGPGEPANNWAAWESAGRVEPSGIACDFWREPEVALDRAASLGCNAFRLSVEWTRIEPRPGEIDDHALDRYASILGACRERAMEPIVTLHHFTQPEWLGEEFWLTPGSPDRFADHVRRVLPRLVPHCRYWVTINEPNIVALMGWVSGAYPPGRRMATSDAVAVLDNLLCAHVLAYRGIHEAQSEAMVTLNTSSSSLYEHDRLLTDLLVARSMGIGRGELDAWLDQRRAIHDVAVAAHTRGELLLRRLFAAASPYGRRGSVGGGGAAGARLRRRSPRRVIDLLYEGPDPRPLDAVGFDWYDPIASHAMRWPGHRSSGGRNWDPARAIWDVPANPEGLAKWCRDQHTLLPDLPVWVVENGIATRVRNGTAYRRLDGWDRPRYLRDHLGAVLDAMDQGVPMGAYLHWSLVDNYEWGSYEPRLGIFGLDRSRGRRGIRWLDTDSDGQDSAETYRSLIAALRRGDRSVLNPL